MLPARAWESLISMRKNTLGPWPAMPRRSPASASKGMCTCTSATHMNAFIHPLPYNIYIYTNMFYDDYGGPACNQQGHADIVRTIRNTNKQMAHTTKSLQGWLRHLCRSRPHACWPQAARHMSCHEAAHMPKPLSQAHPGRRRPPWCHAWQSRCPSRTLNQDTARKAVRHKEQNRDAIWQMHNWKSSKLGATGSNPNKE